VTLGLNDIAVELLAVKKSADRNNGQQEKTEQEEQQHNGRKYPSSRFH